jgi:hypothetical protein
LNLLGILPIVGLFSFLPNYTLFAQALACHNAIQVSLDASCQAVVLPQSILTNTYPSYAGFTVSIGNLPNATVTNAQIGQTLMVSVNETATGNACWASIHVEDKQAPMLVCPATAVNVPCAINNLGISTNEKIAFNTLAGLPSTNLNLFQQPAVSDNCNGVTLYYTDVVDDKDCPSAAAGNQAAIITRLWRAVDGSGNQTTCIQTFNLLRANVNDVLFPSDLTLSCSSGFVLNPQGTPSITQTGVPTINGVNAYPTAAGFCELNTTYSDNVVATCGTNYKVFRTWTVMDWCQITHPGSPTLKTKIQTITIADTQAPVVLPTALNDISVSTDGNFCGVKNYVIPSIVATDNCDPNPIFEYKTLNSYGDPVASGATIPQLLIGEYKILYIAKDNCGNGIAYERKLTVADKTPPVAVCDLNTKVSLGIDGTATVNAVTFDDGSKDNCCLDINRFEIKRSTENDNQFKPNITFSCTDQGVNVVLRVWDCYNNSNTCQVNAVVEDKLTPVIFAKNAPIFVCSNNADAKAWLDLNKPSIKSVNDFPTISNPGYFDNCMANISFEDVAGIDNCGKGTYIRTWTVTDKGGLNATTTQKVRSEARSAYKVTFPEDFKLTCGGNLNSTPASTGKPLVETLAGTCPLVGVEYKDQTFQVNNNIACYKILRTWKILSQCEAKFPLDASKGTELVVKNANGTCGATVPRTYVNIGQSVLLDANFANFVAQNACYTFDQDGYMEYVQVIWVNDTEAPIFTNTIPTSPKTTPDGSNCSTNLVIEPFSATDCSNQLSYSFLVLQGNSIIYKSPIDPTFPFTYSGLAFGDYTVRYVATDNCGNFSTTDRAVSIKDLKKPTPVCHDNLAVALMDNGMVTVRAVVFNGGSSDNCTPKNKLKYRIQVPAPGPGEPFDPTKSDTVYTFMCSPPNAPYDPLKPNSHYETVGLWVGDEAGNWDYCSTIIDIQDNLYVCSYIAIEMRNIAGAIETEQTKPVSNVELRLDSSNVSLKQQIIGNTGKYLFANQYFGRPYKITPFKNDNPTNGVSTFDLVLMSKHILGIQALTSPYQLLAADINHSNTITTADMVELRKLILKVNDNFKNNTSWRFFDKKYQLNDGTKPWNIPEKVHIFQLLQHEQLDFVAVKVGDLNGSAQPNEAPKTAPRNTPTTLTFELEDENLNKGQTVTLPFIVPNHATIEGYQCTIEYDKNALDLLDIQGNSDNFAVLENGIITSSWNGNASADTPLFALVFRAKRPTTLSQVLQLNSKETRAEAYTSDGTLLDMALSFNKASVASPLEVYQNTPNPFSNNTKIGFQLAKEEQVRFSLFDVQGKQIQLEQQFFPKGYNEILVKSEQFPSTGVYYYTLETATCTVTKKMILF